MSDFKAITTQADFDAAIKERLDRERSKYADYETIKAQAKDAEKLQAQVQSLTSENDKLKADAKAAADKYAEHDKTVADLTARATTAEKSLLRRKVAEEAKLPPSLADRLTGETEEDLKKDAKTLAQFIQPQTPAPLASIERPYAAGSKEALEAAVNDAFAGVLHQMKGDV